MDKKHQSANWVSRKSIQKLIFLSESHRLLRFEFNRDSKDIGLLGSNKKGIRVLDLEKAHLLAPNRFEFFVGTGFFWDFLSLSTI